MSPSRNEDPAVMDDGRNRLRVMPEASQQARLSLLLSFAAERK